MTVAIGAHFDGGVIICADTRVMALDGITTEGCKVGLMHVADGRQFAVANSAEDGNAATMLTEQIIEALCASDTPYDLSGPIKKTMSDWYSGYANGQAPGMEFLVSAYSGLRCWLFYCAPPNTILERRGYDSPICIGQGSRTVDPFLPFILPGLSGVKPTLLRLAYLMYRAKKYEAHCGGDTDAIVIWKGNREAKWISRLDMSAAEGIAHHVDAMLQHCALWLLSQESTEDQTKFLKDFSEQYFERVKEIERVTFPSLEATG